jgi:hypothetical protein
MSKQDLSESDIRARYITPALERAGWDGMSQIFHEFGLRAGRIQVRGQAAHRGASTVLKADDALFFKPKIPLAVLEAKDNSHAVDAEKWQQPRMPCVTHLVLHEEFDAEKARWGSEADGCAAQVENERAWKVSLEQIKAANHNLDQKGPDAAEVVSHGPDEPLADCARLQTEAQGLRDQFKAILAQSLGDRA